MRERIIYYLRNVDHSPDVNWKTFNPEEHFVIMGTGVQDPPDKPDGTPEGLLVNTRVPDDDHLVGDAKNAIDKSIIASKEMNEL